MDAQTLIRAINEADPATLKKVKAVADFRLGDTSFSNADRKKGLDTEERLFYSAIVTTLAQHHAGFASYEDADACTRLPGFDLTELTKAHEAVDHIYNRFFSYTTLSKAKFYRLVAACAYNWIVANQERRGAIRYAQQVLRRNREITGPQDSYSDERDKALRYLIRVCSHGTLQLNRSVKGMVHALQHVDTVLEESFPGYMQSGLLRMIVERGTAARRSHAAAEE